MSEPTLKDDDISKYIDIYAETYGEVIDRGVAELHLEVLVEFVELILREDPPSTGEKNEDEQYGPGIRTT